MKRTILLSLVAVSMFIGANNAKAGNIRIHYTDKVECPYPAIETITNIMKENKDIFAVARAFSTPDFFLQKQIMQIRFGVESNSIQFDCRNIRNSDLPLIRIGKTSN